HEVAHQRARAAALRRAHPPEARQVVDAAVAVVVLAVADLALRPHAAHALQRAARALHHARRADADAALARRAARHVRALHVVHLAVAVVIEAVADLGLRHHLADTLPVGRRLRALARGALLQAAVADADAVRAHRA